MPSELSIKDYLETINESSKRVRFTTIVLVIVTLFLVAGNLTIGQLGWMDKRIKKREEQLKIINRKIAELSIINPINVPRADFTPPIGCNEQACDDEALMQDVPNRLACYKCAQNSSEESLRMALRAKVDNYTIKTPFFGFFFDSNDLTPLGGFSLIIVLMMLRLGLRNYIVGLRIGIKAAHKSEEAETFYEIAASRQLFAFPYLEDKDQVSYFGKTESLWIDSSLKHFFDVLMLSYIEFKQRFNNYTWKYIKSVFFLKKKDSNEVLPLPVTLLVTIMLISVIPLILWIGIFIFIASISVLVLTAFSVFTIRMVKTRSLGESESSYKNYWSVNPQPWLKRIPKLFILIPCVVYLISLVKDYETLHVGMILSPDRTAVGFSMCVIFLFIIIGLGLWCMSKWTEIDELWAEFYENVCNKTVDSEAAE